MLAWPEILCPLSGGFAPFVRSLSGGQSLSGYEQVQPQQHDRWTAAFTFHVKSKATLFAVRSLLTQLRGRTGTISLPTFEGGRAPLSAETPGTPLGTAVVDPPFFQRWPQHAGTPFEYTSLGDVTGTATLTIATRFSFVATGDVPEAGMVVTLFGIKRTITNVYGVGPYHCTFEPGVTVGPSTPGTVIAQAEAAGALNATTLDAYFEAGGPPDAGNYFSVDDRLYSINTVQTLSAGHYRLGIWPWLRVAIPSGRLLNFTSPSCEMRLASDGEGADALRSLQSRRYGTVALSFDEVATS